MKSKKELLLIGINKELEWLELKINNLFKCYECEEVGSYKDLDHLITELNKILKYQKELEQLKSESNNETA